MNNHSPTYVFVLILYLLSNHLYGAIFTVQNNNDSESGSLREAIDLASSGDTILFDESLDENAQIVFASGQIEIDKNLTIIGNNSGSTTFNGENQTRLLVILSLVNVKIENITFVNGNKLASSENGGAIWNIGSLSLKNCTFKNNKAFNGGAIFNSNQFDMHTCVFENNQASNYGGAVFYKGFSNTIFIPIIRRSMFASNTAQLDGGAFYNDGHSGNSSPLFLNCIFIWNNAWDDGGVAFNNGSYGVSSPIFVNCTLYGNQAEDDGDIVASYGDWGISITSFYNSIMWQNDANVTKNFKSNNSQILMNYCLVEETTCPTNCNCSDDLGMIYNQDPMFAPNITSFNIGVGANFLLSENSPAINTGSNLFALDYDIVSDLLENNRIMYDIIDMGAFEYSGEMEIEMHSFLFTIKVMLEGAYMPATDLMRSNLANLNLLPQISPFVGTSIAAPFDSIRMTNTNNVVDWIYMELRNTPDGKSIYNQSLLLLEDGTLTDTDGEANFMIDLARFDSLYIVLRHQNHLDIMSQKIAWSDAASTIEYDFTTSIEQALGVNQLKTLDNNKVGMYAGDINWDNSVQNSDYDYWKENPAMLNTYSITDLNLDGHIQVTDFDVWYSNKAKLGNPYLEIN